MKIIIFLYQWLRLSALTLILAFIFIYLLKKTKYKNLIVKTLGVYMLINAWVVLYMCILIDGHYALYYALPLHVCSIVILLCGLSVFYKPQILLEIIYYFGLIGAILALIFPVYVYERSGYLFWDYFIGHGLMLVIIGYHLSNGFIPRKNSALKCYGVFLVVACFVFLLNILLGMNYWYINEDPGFRTGTFISIWPYYLIEWFFFGLGFVLLLQRPFKKYH
jgi:hypothetical integral membrane protein (TIGR02206 family)